MQVQKERTGNVHLFANYFLKSRRQNVSVTFKNFEKENSQTESRLSMWHSDINLCDEIIKSKQIQPTAKCSADQWSELTLPLPTQPR